MCGNLSSFSAPSHWCRSRPYSLVSFFFFLLPHPGTWGFSCLLGGLRSSASVQWVFCRSSSTCRCISDGFLGRKVISTSYSSAILKVPPFLVLRLKPSVLHTAHKACPGVSCPFPAPLTAGRGRPCPFLALSAAPATLPAGCGAPASPLGGPFSQFSPISHLLRKAWSV